MGRPERPVDPEAGPVQRLAHAMRELRRSAGSPAYRAMAREAHFSPTTLSQAAAGERPPSWPVVEAYVRACGGDPAPFEPLWQAAKTAEEEAERAAREKDDAALPYRGLARYEPDDRHLFFGRDRAVGELRRLVREQRIAVLSGASGSGKSSLLKAGLIPHLREAGAAPDRPAVLRVITPGPRPATTYGPLLAPAHDGSETWVAVDQFEEVFTRCRDAEERTRFIDLLLAAREPRSRLRVLIAVRADFYARCGEHRGLADVLSGPGLMLGPMTAEELREVVVRPAQQAGLLVERELTARVVEEVSGRPEGLPLLSHALLETCRRRRGRVLTLAAYEAAGGVRGAIAATAEEVYRRLTPAQARVARGLLLRMVEPGLGAPDTRRPLARAVLEGCTNPDAAVIVERLTRARLLTADQDGVQLAHEALLTHWPRLAGWIEEDRERLHRHARLSEVARAWHDNGRDPGALYRGTALSQAEELFGCQDLLTEAELAFLTAALDARDSEQRAATRTARRHRALLTALFTTLSAVLVTALLVSQAVWNRHREEERQRVDDTARRVAAVADSLRGTDPRTALLLGVAAWRISPLPESRSALLGSLAQPEQDAFTVRSSDTTDLSLTDSGRTLLAVAPGRWTAWDVATHRRSGSGAVPAGTVVAAGPDGRFLADSRADGIRLWDTRTSRWTGGTTPLPLTGSADVAPSGVLVDAEPDRVRVLSVRDGRDLLDIPAHTLVAPAISTVGRTVAVCPTGGTPQVWDIAGRRRVHGAWEHTGVRCDTRTPDVHFSSDRGVGATTPGTPLDLDGSGGRLLALSPGGVRIWNTRTGALTTALNDPGVTQAALSPDGAFLATTDSGELRVWRLSDTDAPVFRHDLDNQVLYGGLAWDPGRAVLRYLEGATVHSLDVSALTAPTWRDAPLADTRLSPDGQVVATAEPAGDSYTFRLLSTRDGHVLSTLPAPPPAPRPASRAAADHGEIQPLMAFAPGGDVFAYGVVAADAGAMGQRVAFWDTRYQRARGLLDLSSGAAAPVGDIVLGPRGRTLYAPRAQSTEGLTTEEWDTVTGRRVRKLGLQAGGVLAVRPDGGLLVGDGRVEALPGGRGADRELVLGGGIAALAFSGDGSLLAAGDSAGRVALWDGRLRQRAGILRDTFPVSQEGDPQPVTALALSHDGGTLAVGGSAGTLQLWDTRTQQPLGGPLTSPGGAVDTLAFSRDGSTLYASAGHAPVRRYVLDPRRAAAAVCARAGGAGLTRAQWRQYVRNVPYRPVCG